MRKVLPRVVLGVGALVCGAAGFTIYGVAPNGWLFWIGVPIMSFWGMAGPASQALMTRLVSASEQGQLQGANMSVGSIAGVASPLFFGFVYSVSVEEAPGASFVIAAAILLASAGLGHLVAKRHGTSGSAGA